MENNKITKLAYLFIIPALFALLFTPSILCAVDRVYLDITSAEKRKINFAIPWFSTGSSVTTNNEFSKGLADTLAKSLKFHGIINIIPTKSYQGSQNSDWKKLGADFSVLGLYTITSNTLKLELRLFDVANDKMILGKSFSGNLKQKAEMLYRFCNSVIKELTGSSGIALSQIAYVSLKNKKKEIYITDILGRKVRQVTRHKNLVVSPRYVPGGKFLTYTSYHTGNQNLYITDLDQNKTTRVLSQRSGMNLAPGWAPDGQTMVLTLSYKGNPDLYLLNKRGKILRALTSRAGINVSASFSPDGKRIVFVSDRSGRPQLYLMNIKSKNVQRLTFEGAENAEPTWHPTEDIIVYSSLRDGVYQIFTTPPVQGATPLQLTTDMSHHESPSWSPDGNQIIFSKQDGRANKIYAMMKNGSYQRMLFSFPGSQIYPRWSSN